MGLGALALMAAASTAFAKTIVITAGKGGLVFSPDTSTADVGDVLEFHFMGSTHTVMQGDPSKACQRASGGFASGPFTSNKADGSGNVFQVTVKDTNPIFFYCSAPTHCQNGMVGGVNLGSQSLDRRWRKSHQNKNLQAPCPKGCETSENFSSADRW
jgi:plastocyanin